MNIELMTLSEVVDVSGGKGNFSVSVKKHPRYIDTEKCIACGACAEKCPKKVEDEFDMGQGKRKAAYIKFGQTVPLKYAIDPQSCIYLTKGKCRACEKFCPTNAINFEDVVQTTNIQVGSIIMSSGFKPFDPSGVDLYNYDQVPDVVTSMEYERLLSSSGPCMGQLRKPSDDKEPQKIAWIQCVGSRDTNRCGNGYCSSVCCMYAIKQAQVTPEHLQENEAEETIFYMDIRTHGKEFERYFEEAKGHGVKFVQARPHSLLPGPSQVGVNMQYFTEDGQLREEYFDMIVLSVGMEVEESSMRLAENIGIELNPYGFARTSSFEPVSTSVDGVYVSGAFVGPKSIPSAVTEASTAAIEAAKDLLPAKNTLTQEKTYPEEWDVYDKEPRIGVFVCSCGINIAGVIDVKEVAEYAAELPNVVLVENNLFTCSTDAQEMIAQKMKENNLNRIVIAACTPRTHEPLFQDTLQEAGLNSYLIEMANIRNHNSWVHQKEPEKATAKAKDQVRMAVAKASRDYPLQELQVDVVQKALVVGGGLAGLTAAKELGDLGYPAVLLEKGDALGGNSLLLNKTYKGEEIKPVVQQLVQDVENHENIEVWKNARLTSATGSVGHFSSTVDVGGETKQLEYGAGVIATGATESRPDYYLLGSDSRVMTHLDFDRELREEPEKVANIQTAVFIQCVGSRTPERPYCSRVCCTHTMKSAISLKETNPEMNVFVLYRDIRTYGLREDLYTRAREKGVVFIRYDLEDMPDVSQKGTELQVGVTEHILNRKVNISTDRLILATAIVPRESSELVELYKCGLNEDGFMNEAHPKLRPVDMSVDGLFLAGICNYPKSIDESVSQAKAAASRAGVLLSRDVMKLDAIKAEVTEHCDGCALCLDVCPYGALSLIDISEEGEDRKLIKVDKAVCKGCGLCEATCPKDGINVEGFTVDQLRSQVDTLLEVNPKEVAK